MGSGATAQPISPSLKKQKSKINIIPINKQKQVQQPKPLIAKLVVKQIDISQGLSRAQQVQLQQIKTLLLHEFENRFLLKVSLNQIRLIFTQYAPLQNKSQISSKHHESSLKKLRQKCLADLAVYRQICLMKMNCLIAQKLKLAQKQLQTKESFQNFKQAVKNQCSHLVQSLIGEILGKSSIWHSLNLTNKQKIRNLINYLHQQGIDSQKIETINKIHKIDNI